MSGEVYNLNQPESLQWLWLLVPVALLFALDLRRRHRVLQLFVSRSLLDDVHPRRSIARPIVKFLILATGLASLTFALARPQWDPEEIELEQQGQNLLFCLDVSNSMRACDVDPSRLEAAKEAIRRLVTHLPAGNQVGLLAYAGSSELKCPLTPNYSHFLSVLSRVTYNSVDVGGTDLGKAIDMASRHVFGYSDEDIAQSADEDRDKPGVGQTVMQDEKPQEDQNANVLIILTDGENHEGYARERAIEAHRLGVAIYIIGLGTEQGAPIPIEENGKIRHLQYQGRDVITKFDEASLRKVVEALPSRAGFLPAGNATVDLVDVYERAISKQGRETKQLRFTVWQEKFQIFVGLGLAMVMLSTLISEQGPGRKLALRIEN